MLSDTGIRIALESGLMKIDPYPTDELIQPATIDIKLGGDGVMRYNTNSVNIHKPFIVPGDDLSDMMEFVPFNEDGCVILQPGDFFLGTTEEYVEIGDSIAARVEGKSSLGRAGLIPHAAAGFIDPGFKGRITLEMSNLAPLAIRLCKGMRIGQMAFIPLSSVAARPYGSKGLGSKYQGQTDPTPARGQQIAD
jgi:dCTP deaminase